MTKERDKKKVAVVPIRLPEDMSIRIKKLKSESTLSEQDILRMSLVRGLPLLEKALAFAE